MGLSKRRIGDLIAICNEKNTEARSLPFYGINKEKTFMPTAATTDNLDNRKYKIMTQNRFVFSGMQTGRDMCIRIGLYELPFDALISPAYTTFEISSSDVLPEYFFMIFKSSEMDRYGAFLSDASVRANLDWDVFCNIELELPSVPIQQKYVDIYRGVQENLDAMNRGVEESKRSYEILLDRAVHSSDKHPIGDYIEETDVRNVDLMFGQSDVKGMTITKEIIPTKANTAKAEVSNYKIVYPNEFVYNPRTHGKKIGLGFNYTNEPFIISWNNSSFKIKDGKSDDILPEYLYLCFCRSEWDREACFQSWGSSTEVFSWNALCGIEVGVPDISEQTAIVEIYNAVRKRLLLINRLSTLQKALCPVLIRGAIEEGGRS